MFTKRMKLGDLIHANYNLLPVLPRFGINLGFGDRTIEEVCQRNGVSVNLFLMVCNVYTFDDYLPDEKELESFSLDDLMIYLQNSHKYYIGERIPGIQKELLEITSRCEAKYGTVLERFFDEYQQEVASHLNYEEDTVFPYIHNLVLEPHNTNYRIENFEKNHSNIEDKLNDLKNIIIKYLPDTDDSSHRSDILFHLFLLEDDLNKHTVIEDKILVPLVTRLERRMS